MSIWGVWHGSIPSICPASRVTTLTHDHLIQALHLCGHLRPATATTNEAVGLFNTQISPHTVRVWLREANSRARCPRHGLDLNPPGRRQLFAWVNRHICWMLAPGRNVLFSDKSRFLLHRADGRQRVWRYMEQGGGGGGGGAGVIIIRRVTHCFGLEFPMDTAHNSMALWVIWRLSDTAMTYCARSSCPSFARTTPFSSTTMPDLTSPTFA